MKRILLVAAGFCLVMLFGAAIAAEAHEIRFSFGFSFGYGGYCWPYGLHAYYGGYYPYGYWRYHRPYYPVPVIRYYRHVPYRVYRANVRDYRYDARVYSHYVPRRYHRR